MAAHWWKKTVQTLTKGFRGIKLTPYILTQQAVDDVGQRGAGFKYLGRKEEKTQGHVWELEDMVEGYQFEGARMN